MATKCTRSMTCRCPDCSAAMQMFSAKDLVAVASSKVDFSHTEEEPTETTASGVSKPTAAMKQSDVSMEVASVPAPEKTAPIEKKKMLPSLAERKAMMKQKMAQQLTADDLVVVAAPSTKKSTEDGVPAVVSSGGKSSPADVVSDPESEAFSSRVTNQPMSRKMTSDGGIDNPMENSITEPVVSSSLSPDDTRSGEPAPPAGKVDDEKVLDQWLKPRLTDATIASAMKPTDLISPRLARLVPLDSDMNQTQIGSTDPTMAGADDANKTTVRRRRTGPRFSKAFPVVEGSEKENTLAGFSSSSSPTLETTVHDQRSDLVAEKSQSEPQDGRHQIHGDPTAGFLLKHAGAEGEQREQKRTQEEAGLTSSSTEQVTGIDRRKEAAEEQPLRTLNMALSAQESHAGQEESKQPEVADENDYSTMGISERLASSDWKARKSGYEELAKTPSIDNNLLSLLESSLSNEAHASALDAVLEACLAAVKKGSPDLREEDSRASRWIPALGKRCFTGRPATRQRAIDVVLELFAVDSPKAVANALVAELNSKNAKVVVACLSCLRDACSQFGAGKVVPAASIVTAVEMGMAATPPAIRAEGCALAVDAIAWLGDAFKVLINSKLATDAQRKELDRRLKDETDKNGGSMPEKKPSRFRRGMDNAGNGSASGANAASLNGGGSAVGGNDDDVFDLLTVHDVLSKLEKPLELEKRLKEPKWSERKDVLLEVETACGKPPKLAPGDYAPLVSTLKKVVVNDSHQAVVIQALSVLLALSEGLRASFAPYARASLMILLEKLRDQKKPITAAVDLTLDCYAKWCFSIGDERVIALIGDAISTPKATPLQIRNIMLWIERNCSGGNVVHWPNVKYDLGPLRDVIKSKVGHPDPSVRQAVSAAMTALRPNEATAEGKSRVDLKHKPAEVSSSSSVATSTGASAQATSRPAAAKPLAGLPPPAPPARSSAAASSSAVPAAARLSSSSSGPSSIIGFRRPSGSGAGRPASGSVDSAASSSGRTQLEPSPSQIADETLSGLYRANPTLKQAVQLEKNSTRWEERAAVLMALQQALRNAPPDAMKGSLQLDAMLRYIGSKTREFQDANPTIMQAALECVKTCIQRFNEPCEYYETTILTSAASKLSDRKQNPMATQILMELSSGVYGPAWTMSRMLRCARAAASPKTKQAIYDWLSECVAGFGIDQLYWKEDELNFEDFIKVVCSEDGVMNTSHEVRSSATSLLGEFCKQFGVTRFQKLPHIPPSVSLECHRKVGGATLLPPNRVWRFKPADLDSKDLFASDKDSKPVDVSAEIEPLLPVLLTSDAPSWKKREEALMHVERIFTPKRPVVTNRAVKELAVALGKRLDDTQRNLAARAAICIGVMAECVGATGCASLIKSFGERLIVALGDSKKNVATACQTTMTLCVCHDGRISCPALTAMLQHCIEPLRLGKIDRVKLLGWICERLEEREEQELLAEEAVPGYFDPLKQVFLELIAPLVGCFTAKEAPARKAAIKVAEIVAGFLTEQAAATRFRAGIRDLKGAEQRLVGPIVEEVLTAAVAIRRKRQEEQEKIRSRATQGVHEEDESVAQPIYQQAQEEEEFADKGEEFVRRFAAAAPSNVTAMPHTPPVPQDSDVATSFQQDDSALLTPATLSFSQQHSHDDIMATPMHSFVHQQTEEYYTPMQAGGGLAHSGDAMDEFGEMDAQEEDEKGEEGEEEPVSFEYLVECWNPETEQSRAQLKRHISRTFSRELAQQLFGDRKQMSKALQAVDAAADRLNRDPMPLLLWATVFLNDEESNSPLVASLGHLLSRTLESAGRRHKVQLNDFDAEAFLPYLLNRFRDVDTMPAQLRNTLTTALQNVALVYRADRNLRFLCRYACADGVDALVQSECLMEAARLVEEAKGCALLEDDPEIVERISKCLGHDRPARVRSAAFHFVETVYRKSNRNSKLIADWFGVPVAQALTGGGDALLMMKAMPETPPSPMKSPAAARVASPLPAATVANTNNLSTLSTTSTSSLSGTTALPPITYSSPAEKTLKTKVRDIQEYELHLQATLSPSMTLSSPPGKLAGGKEALLFARAEAAFKFFGQYTTHSPLAGVDDFEWTRLVEECLDVNILLQSCGRILEQLAVRGSSPAAWKRTSWLCHTCRLVVLCIEAVFKNKSLQVLADADSIEIVVENLLVLHARVRSSSRDERHLLDLIEQAFFGSLARAPLWIVTVLKLKPVVANSSEFLLKGIITYCHKQESMGMGGNGEMTGQDEEEDSPPFFGVDLDECLREAKRATWVPLEVIRTLERVVGEESLTIHPPRATFMASPEPVPHRGDDGDEGDISKDTAEDKDPMSSNYLSSVANPVSPAALVTPSPAAEMTIASVVDEDKQEQTEEEEAGQLVNAKQTPEPMEQTTPMSALPSPPKASAYEDAEPEPEPEPIEEQVQLPPNAEREDEDEKNLSCAAFEEDEFEFLVGKIQEMRKSGADEEETRGAITQLARFKADHPAFFVSKFPPDGVIQPDQLFPGESRLFLLYLKDKLNDEEAIRAVSTTTSSPGEIKRGLDRLMNRAGVVE